MLHRFFLPLAVLVVVSGVPGVADARAPYPKLRPGVGVTATTSASDPTWSGRGPFKAFSFDADEADRVVITVTSTAFDAHVTVGRVVNGIFDPLANDDDGGGGQNARVVFRVPATGTYVVIAQSIGAHQAGPFDVALRVLPPVKPAVPRPITVGAKVEETLTVTDAFDQHDRHHHLWRFTGRAGTTLLAEMRSTAFDSYLELAHVRPDGRVEPFAADDDGGDGLNARLRATLPVDGDYVLAAKAMSARVGAYTLTLGELVVPPLPPARPLAVGGEREANLSAADAFDQHERRYHLWTFTAEAGDQCVLAMNSFTLDPVIEVGRVRDGGFDAIASDDDGGHGNNARLRFTAPVAGEYAIKATALGGNFGAYTLRLERFAVPPAPAPRPIALDARLDAALATNDAFDETERHYHLYRFSGRRGDTVVVEMRSPQLDAVLALAVVVDGDLATIATDDDGGGGTDARLSATLPRDAEYVLRATTAQARQVGPYALALRRLVLPPPPAARPLVPGRQVTATLSATDAFDEAERYYHHWTLAGRGGDIYVIEMRSSEVDSLILVGRHGDGPFEPVAIDDDSGGGADAKLRLALPDDGELLVRATAMRKQLGAYTLVARPFVVPPPPTPRRLAVGRAVEATLADDDAFDDRDRRYHLWAFTGDAGDIYAVTMGSGMADALLELGRLEGGVFTPIASDDDGGEGTNARLALALPESGRWVVKATTATPRLGPYSLRLERIVLPPAPPPRPLAFGASVEASLDDRAPHDVNERRYHLWRFAGKAGEVVVVDMKARSDIDPVVAAGRMGPAGLDVLAADDDGGEGYDARLRFAVPEDGEYVVRTSAMPRQQGAYTVSLAKFVLPAAPPPRPIAVGATVDAALGEDDPYDMDEDRYHDWRFTGRAGDHLLIDMRSSVVDPMLAFGRLRDGAFVGMLANDDGGEGANARLRVVLPEDGEYVIRALALERKLGPYSLTLAATPPPPPPIPIRAGEIVRGELTSGSPVLDDGTYHVDYVYTGRFRERIVVTQRAATFDAFLVIGRADGPIFEQLAFDDDGAGGTDARLELTLPADGRFIIRANSVSTTEGAFTLEVRSE